MEKIKYDKNSCLELLRAMSERLAERGERRFPRRSDFSCDEVVAIKAFLGPWPRALEAAGLKPPRKDDRLALNREKRARAKRRRNEARKAAEAQKVSETPPA